MQSPSARSPRKTKHLSQDSPAPLQVDNVDRLTRLLNSALKDKKFDNESSNGPDSADDVERIKELESKLLVAKREIKRHKNESQALKSEREDLIQEVRSLTSMNVDLQETLQSVHEQLLGHEEGADQVAQEQEVAELSHAKAMALLEKENLLLQNELHDTVLAASAATAEVAAIHRKITELEAALEDRARDSGALVQTLEGAVRRCEQLQEEGRSKDSEIAELQDCLDKTRALHVLEQEMAAAAAEESAEDCRVLRAEVARLREAQRELEEDLEALRQQGGESDELEATVRVLREEVGGLKDATVTLEEAAASSRELQLMCEQLQAERDELKQSLELFEEEESLAVAELKSVIAALQADLDKAQSSLLTFQEDTAATLEDHRAEAQKQLMEIRALKEALRAGEERDAALEEERSEVQKLLRTVEELQAAAEATNASLQEESARRELCEEEGDTLAKLRDEVETLKKCNADLKTTASEKSAEAAQLKEKARSLREEFFSEKEIAGALLEELKAALCEKDLELKETNVKLKKALAEGKSALHAAEKEIAGLKSQSHTDVGGLNKRMQALKTQKDLAQQRAEAAEGKLLAASSQLLEATKGLEVMGKEKVVLEKIIRRLESERDRGKKEGAAEAAAVEQPPPSPSRRSSSRAVNGASLPASVVSGEEEVRNTPGFTVATITLTLVIALFALYTTTTPAV